MEPTAPRGGVRRWRVLGAVLGAALGHGTWSAAAGSLPEADPARWVLHGSSVPLEVAANAGTLPNDPAALDLWSYRAVSPRVPAFREGTVTIDAVVPPDAQLLVRLGADARSTGPVPPVRPAYAPGAPQGAAVRDAGPARPPEGGALLVFDRSSRDAVWAKRIVCEPAEAPEGEVRLAIEVRGDVTTVTANGKPLTTCRGTWDPGDLVIGAGLRRVRVERVAVDGFEDDFSGGLRSTAARAGATVLGGILGAATVASGALTVALLPLLALPLLGGVSMRQTLDALRLLEVPDALGPLLFCGIPALAGALLVLSSRRSARGAALLGLAPAALTGVAAAFAGLPADTPGWVLLALAALPWTLLGWVNTHPVGRRAVASYALLGAVVLLGEVGVRQTALDAVWTRTSGWRRASEEFAELLEIRRYRSYPLDGFPVQPPPPSEKKRIVAMGGSSTGGAFQMDDLSLFWPRRLEELLPTDTWEVVNQGVGGWNTLHVRLYLESQIERLAPDLLVLYVGHNDVLSAAPVPYRELYARYRSGSSAAKAVSSTLHNVRLYVGLKYALLALRDRTGAVAVPTDDARENLTAVLDVAEAHGAKVVLVTEALNPDPVPLRDYAAMQRSLATTRGHYYFDASEALYREADPTLFLDDCHLSEGGHRRLASLLHGYLREAGLVP